MAEKAKDAAKAKVEAPVAEAPAADTEKELSVKEAIYTKVGEFVKEKTGKRIGKTGGREVFDLIVDEIFAAAVKEGTFRFNGGFGSMHLRTYQAGSRRLPSGTNTTFGERKKLRYEEGVVVKALIGNGGNLIEALKARGTRTPAKAAEAPAAKATKVAAEGAVDLD